MRCYVINIFLLCFISAVQVGCFVQRFNMNNTSVLLSQSFAVDNAIRPNEWNSETIRRFAGVCISPKKELLAVAIDPEDALYSVQTPPISNQVYILIRKDSDSGLIKMPYAPLSICKLMEELQHQKQSTWTEYGIKYEHVRQLFEQFKHRKLKRFTIAQHLDAPQYDAEWDSQMQLLATAITAAVQARSITRGTFVFRDLHVLDEQYLAVACCDNEYYNLHISAVRDSSNLSVIRFDAIFEPICAKTYDVSIDAIQRCGVGRVWFAAPSGRISGSGLNKEVEKVTSQ